MAPSGVAPTLRCRALVDVRPMRPSEATPTQRWIARVVRGPIAPSTASFPGAAMALRVVERETVETAVERETATTVAADLAGAVASLAPPPLARVSPAPMGVPPQRQPLPPSPLPL